MEMVFLVLVFTVLGPSNQWTVKSYPTLEGKCKVKKPTLVCDPDEVLVEQDRQLANAMLQRINSQTECDCYNKKLCTNDTGGYSVGMAVIKSLEALGPRMPGDPELIETFADTTRHRWNLGHCGDDALIVICSDCETILLKHGDWTKRKIPPRIQRAMEHEANQLQAFTNYTLAMDFLFTNYFTYLSNKNQTPSLSMMKFPFEDLSTGVITVMILTTLLAVIWTICVTYLIMQAIHRRRIQKSTVKKVDNGSLLKSEKESSDSSASYGTPRVDTSSPQTTTTATNGAAVGGLQQLTKLELHRTPCWDRPPKWQWRGRRSSSSAALSEISTSRDTTPIIRGGSVRKTPYGSERRMYIRNRSQRLDVVALMGREGKRKKAMRVKSFTSSTASTTRPPTDETLQRNESLPILDVGSQNELLAT